MRKRKALTSAPTHTDSSIRLDVEKQNSNIEDWHTG